MANPSAEFWVNLVTLIVIGGAGGVGALLFFVLRGIRENQTRIWDWAAGEVKALHGEVRQTHALHAKESRDVRRWVRHELREVRCELIAVAKLVVGQDSEDVVESIESGLRKDDL